MKRDLLTKIIVRVMIWKGHFDVRSMHPCQVLHVAPGRFYCHSLQSQLSPPGGRKMRNQR